MKKEKDRRAFAQFWGMQDPILELTRIFSSRMLVETFDRAHLRDTTQCAH